MKLDIQKFATILNEKQSTAGSPYVYYTVETTASSRTVNSVKIKITVTSHLADQSSSLGSGSSYTLTGYLKLNGTEHSITLKGSTSTWSGTTEHTSSTTVTVKDLSASQTSITNVKFRVERGNRSTSAAGYLSSTSCSNITIPRGHTNPTLAVNSVTEQNTMLTDIGITNTQFVPYLSQKEFNFTIRCYDSATPTSLKITDTNLSKNYSVTTLPTTTGSHTFNSQTISFTKIGHSGSTTSFKFTLIDSLSTTDSTSKNYTYIPYELVNLVNSSTYARRNGQLTGKVKLNILGTYFSGMVGNQQNLLTLKYRFWEKVEDEPTTWNTINNSDIVYDNDNFSVNDLEIGSEDTEASNYFNPEKTYYVKIYAVDSFGKDYTVLSSITVGKPVWSEYIDHVDFEKITVKGADISPTFLSIDDSEGCVTIGNLCIQWGVATVTPSSGSGGNYYGSTVVNFSKTYTKIPCVMAVAGGGYTTIKNVSAMSVTKTSAGIWMSSENTTARNVRWLVIGQI